MTKVSNLVTKPQEIVECSFSEAIPLLEKLRLQGRYAASMEILKGKGRYRFFVQALPNTIKPT